MLMTYLQLQIYGKGFRKKNIFVQCSVTFVIQEYSKMSHAEKENKEISWPS